MRSSDFPCNISNETNSLLFCRFMCLTICFGLCAFDYDLYANEFAFLFGRYRYVDGNFFNFLMWELFDMNSI